MNSRQNTLAVVLCAMVAYSAGASEFRIVGPRALSMGGAGVARPDGAFAAYYNPAALALHPESKAVALSLGISARDTGLGEHLQSIMDLDVDWDQATKNPQGPDAAKIIDQIKQINSNDGLFVLPGGALGVKAGPLGLGAYPSAQVAIYADLDKVHMNPTDPTTDPDSFFYNTSTLHAQGLGLVEVPIAYGMRFNAGDGALCVGGALKFMEGITYDVSQQLTTDMKDVQDKLQNADKTATSFGVDAGALYETGSGGFTAGLIVRNLNSPKFETVNGDKFAEKMQARAGVAYSITKSVEADADVDLTANETLVSDYKSRKAGGGLCWQATRGMSLRGGLMTNLEGGSAPVVFCAGLALGFQSFNLDLAAAVPSKWTTIDDYKIPGDGSVTLMLKSAW